MGAAGPVVQVRSYRGVYEPHAHAHHQFVLSLSGETEMEIDGRPARVGGVDAVFIAPGIGHGNHAPHGHLATVVDLPEAFAERAMDPLAEACDGWRVFSLDAPLIHLTRYAALRGGREGLGRDEAERWCALFVGAVLAGLPAAPGRHERRIARAAALARARCGTALRVRDLAGAAALSESAFHAAFRRSTGTTPAAHLRGLRLERACELLNGGDLSIAEIALETGYGDQTALTRAMRRQLGVTPAAYRRRLRGG